MSIQLFCQISALREATSQTLKRLVATVIDDGCTTCVFGTKHKHCQENTSTITTNSNYTFAKRILILQEI